MVANPRLEDKFQLIGIAISLIFYGEPVFLVNFFTCLTDAHTGSNVCLIVQLSPAYREARMWTNIVTFIMFALVSTVQSLMSYVTIEGFVDHCNALDDPVIWFANEDLVGIWLAIWSSGLVAVWILDSCMVCTVALLDFFQHLTRSLQLYQCFTVYSLRKKELWLVGIPLLLFFSSFGNASYISLIIPLRTQCGAGSGAYLLLMSTEPALRVLPHFPLCLLTKLTMTSLIVVKLLRQRKILNEDLGIDDKKELTRPYTSLIHVLIQSYALYSSFSALFLGLYIADNSAWRIALPNAAQAGVRRCRYWTTLSNPLLSSSSLHHTYLFAFMWCETDVINHPTRQRLLHQYAFLESTRMSQTTVMWGMSDRCFQPLTTSTYIPSLVPVIGLSSVITHALFQTTLNFRDWTLAQFSSKINHGTR